MARLRINPLSFLFVVGVLAYGMFTVNRHGRRMADGSATQPAESPALVDESTDVSPAPPPVKKGTVLGGRVHKVVDGDTIDLRVQDGDTVRLRLEGIDAPEFGQPFSEEAREYLRQLCADQVVYAMLLERDRYDRLVADVYLDNTWVNGEMVKAGYAWHYSRYNSSPQLAELERRARQEARGLWSDRVATAPWEFRHADPR